MPVANGLYYFFHESRQIEKKLSPLVLIHGAGGNSLSFPPQIRRMEAGDIYALDLPGHGQSQGLGRQSIEEYADEVAAWMKALKIRRAIFAGVSMGSAIALTLALKYPRKARGLALIGAGARLRVSPQILDTAGGESTFEAAVDLVNQNCFSADAPPSLLELSKRQLMEMRPPTLLGDFLACNEFNVMERLPEIKTSTLILCGAQDKMTPLKYSQYLKDNLPKAQLRVLENAGHLAMLEQPDVVAELLKAFVESMPVRARKKNVEQA
ncbi:MAG: alpha/beta hydrolase [Anaerolineales bacterium]